MESMKGRDTAPVTQMLCHKAGKGELHKEGSLLLQHRRNESIFNVSFAGTWMIMFKNKAYKKQKKTMDNNFMLWKGNLTSERTRNLFQMQMFPQGGQIQHLHVIIPAKFQRAKWENENEKV